MSHGLAASIRCAIDSTTFDLAGMNLVTIENVVREAFTDPMELKEMIRLTFITGAGKLGRAKYDDKADKAMTSTLKELGYNEDRGASAVMECAGLFKLQHDTGKNLKTVVVFPKMNVVQTEQTTESNRDGTNSVFVDDSSPRGKLVYASIEVFKKMVEIQCVTWSQKKVCVSVLVEMQESLKKCDETLLKGQQLSTDDQQFYDTMNSNALDEKSSIVRDLMQKQVKDGFVTADEKQLLLSQIEDKIKELESECLEAESNSKPKLLNKLRDLQTKAVARKEMLDSITPRPPPKLKHAAEIAKLYTELAPLLVIEESCKGRLLSLKESQTMARKDEIQAEILSLELSSRGWFETDESFENRVSASRIQNRKVSRNKPSTKNSTTTTKKPASQFVSVGAKKPTSAAWNKPVTNSKSVATGGLFAAMMGESDSD